MYVGLYVCMYVCKYVCMYVCMYVSMCVFFFIKHAPLHCVILHAMLPLISLFFVL